MSQLQTTSYQKLDKNPTKSFNKTIINFVKEEINNENLPSNASALFLQHPRTSVFYMLPKIHKPNNPGRPIVSAISCPTSQIAAYLDSIFTPIVQDLPTYVKDSSHALRIFKEFTFTGPNKYLFTMDVKSLYTCIPHNDGLQALKFFLDKRPHQSPPTTTLLRLAELVLTTNAFSFNSQYYLQKSGVAMGSKLGPSYACLFVGHQEQLIYDSYDGPLPCLIKRYIDDIVGATSLPLADLQRFINYTNSFHPALQFTHSITEESLPFLDILLSISNNRISTSIFYKPTDAHCLLNYESSHPKKCKDSIPYSQLRRLRRICSNDDDFHLKAEEMSSFFKQNNYPKHATQAALNKVKDLSQDDALLPSNNATSNDRTPFILTYHPFNNNVKDIIYSNFNILTNDTHTKNIFDTPPLLAFRRDKNLKDSLVRTNLTTTQQPGTSPCQHRLCQTCTHINQSTTITNQNHSFNIRSHFTGSSSCVIYCVICIKCQSFYISETSRQINNRFGEHKRNVRNNIHLEEKHENDPDSNISKHFNSTNHSTDDMSILGLLYAPVDTTKRKTLEKRLIFNLKTLYPSGLNKQFTYLQ